jgi:hypothetical protein
MDQIEPRSKKNRVKMSITLAPESRDYLLTLADSLNLHYSHLLDELILQHQNGVPGKPLHLVEKISQLDQSITELRQKIESKT